MIALDQREKVRKQAEDWENVIPETPKIQMIIIHEGFLDLD